MGLDGTALQENNNLYEEWKKCSHASHNGMEIIGTLANTPSGRLILMFCVKDGRVYGCADGHLQVISSSLQKLFDEGPQFTAVEFDHMSDCKVGALL